MELFTKSVKNSSFILISLLVLSVQNIIIYFNHYFNRIGFPWDFDKSYFVTPAFWTTAINFGNFPQWIPFQSMGFPLLMKSQHVLFYPFFWIFPILGITFTLQTAVFFQILHILAGSIGIFFLLKFLVNSPRYALIGAIAFQFFGGFFANSSHQDIIRAFAIAPWLFYVFTLNVERPTLNRRVLFIPIVIFVMINGSYAGIVISSIFVMTLFVFLQGINGLQRIGKQKSIIITSSMFGLLILGIFASMVWIGPFLEFGNELTRFGPDSVTRHKVLNFKEFPTFFMINQSIPGELTMTSTFLPLPILIFASFLPVRLIKKYWFFFVILGVAILMALGKQTFFWNGITSIFPALELSRFTSSDYRIFIAIPLLIFGIVGLKSIIEKKISLKTFFVRTGFILSWFSIGIFILYSVSTPSRWWDSFELLNKQVILAAIILSITLIFVGYYVMKTKKSEISSIKKPIFPSLILCAFLVILISSNGFVVITDTITWNRSEFDARYVSNNVPLEKNGELTTFSIFENLPEERPERILSQGKTDFPWKGVLTGDYMMSDSGNTVLLSRAIVEENESYMNFMKMKWTPILLEPNTELNLERILLPEDIFSNIDTKTSQTAVIQTHYGINDISYKISLDEPKLMVENEIYFPGWTATLIFPDKQVLIQAIEVNDAFRAWALPAGDYEMKANFQFPNFEKYLIISISAFTIWVVLAIIFWGKVERKHPFDYRNN